MRPRRVKPQSLTPFIIFTKVTNPTHFSLLGIITHHVSKAQMIATIDKRRNFFLGVKNPYTYDCQLNK